MVRHKLTTSSLAATGAVMKALIGLFSKGMRKTFGSITAW
jgi:hypothetical protein